MGVAVSKSGEVRQGGGWIYLVCNVLFRKELALIVCYVVLQMSEDI